MHNVDIEIFCIAQTRMNPGPTRKWLDRCGASEYPVPVVNDEDLDKTKETTDATAVCGLCSKRCYMAFEAGLNPNVTRVRKVWTEYWTNVLKSGHGSVTEHASFTFAIEGVSRVFTAEMNRHRAGVGISEGSMRYIRFDDIGFWMPHSLREEDRTLMPTKRCKACKGKPESVDDGYDRVGCGECYGTGRINLMTEEEFSTKKNQTRVLFNKGFRDMEANYRALCLTWDIENMKAFSTKKKLTSMFRRIIGMGVATGGCWTMNVRAMRHIMALRTAPGVEEEIAYVMGMVGKHMVENEPALFGDFKRDEATGAWVPEHIKV